MANVHYLNNKWVKDEDLTVSAFDLAVTRGYGVFDFLRTYNNIPFKLDEHLNRFFNSAKMMGLEIPKTKKEITEIVYEGLKKNKDKEKNIKIVLTGGPSTDGITPDGKSTFLVMISAAFEYPKACYEKGVKIVTMRATRAFPDAKTLNYQTAVVAMMQAKKKGAQEAIYIDKKGRILEATRSNFFAVIDEQLITPEKDVLIGITRNVVIELANKLGTKVIKRDIYLNELPNFQEVFITSSNKEVLPVVKIDEKSVKQNQVGKVTKKIMSEFKKITRNG